MPSIVGTGPASAALLVLLTLAPRAAGQSSPAEREKVRLHFEAPESCAERDQFLPQVRARMGTGWEAGPGELARTIDVKVTRAGDRYVARIGLQDARGQHVARAIAGTRCAQVIEGIALVTVLAIQAQLDELISQSQPAADDARSPGKPPNEVTPPVAPAPAPPAPVEPRPRPVSPSSSTELELRLGGRGLVQQGVGPEVAWGYGGFVGLTWPDWTLQLSLDAATTGRVVADVVPARFELLAARLDVCGRFELLTPVFSVEPGIFFQVGELEAQGYSNLPAVTRGSGGTTKWLAPGLLLAVRAELAHIFLGLEATVAFPLDWEQFYVADGDRKNPVYTVPWLSSGAALAAGVNF